MTLPQQEGQSEENEEKKEESGFVDSRTGKSLSFAKVEWRMNRPDQHWKAKITIYTIVFILFDYWFFFRGGINLLTQGLIP